MQMVFSDYGNRDSLHTPEFHTFSLKLALLPFHRLFHSECYSFYLITTYIYRALHALPRDMERDDSRSDKLFILGHHTDGFRDFD